VPAKEGILGQITSLISIISDSLERPDSLDETLATGSEAAEKGIDMMSTSLMALSLEHQRDTHRRCASNRARACWTGK
jgi:hypothetical protein